METKIFKKDDLEEAARILREGGLVAFPTETVYGLGADARDSKAAGRIYAAKGRPSDNPLIVHLARREDIAGIAREIPSSAQKLIDAFMPGPITLILKKQPSVPDTVTAGLDTVAVRIPADETARRLIELSGVPVAAPSANISGKPSPTSFEHVLHDMDGRIEAIVDGGEASVGVESTIVDCTGETPLILRPGGITPEMVRSIVPGARVDEGILRSLKADERPKCPGMKYKHYAPDALVTVVEGEAEAVHEKICALLQECRGKTGVLAQSRRDYPADVVITAGEENREYASRLFSCLREFDEKKVEVVFAEFTERDGYGLAVKNRLYKAAGGLVIRV